MIMEMRKRGREISTFIEICNINREIFPENRVRNPCPKIYRNFRNMSKMSKMIEIFGLFRIFRKSGTAVRPKKQQKMFKNTKSCFSRPLSVLGRFWMRFWNVCILTKCVWRTALIWTDVAYMDALNSGSGKCWTKWSKYNNYFR